METKISDNSTHFVGKKEGKWQVLSNNTIVGEAIPHSKCIDILKPNEQREALPNIDWILRGFNSNLRYTTREEKNTLDQTPSVLDKVENKLACLIPIKKNAAWWNLTQDERRQIIVSSQHINVGFDYLSTISRQLFHSRDLGEPFDFLTWFEFSPENESKFDALLQFLRSTEEWKYVEREVEIRLVRK